MSELGETFDGWRAMKQRKRAGNRENSAALLTKRGFAFEAKNDGAHLIVTAGSTVVDFWPGTGLWHARGSSRKGRGVFGLMRFLTPNAELSGALQRVRTSAPG